MLFPPHAYESPQRAADLMYLNDADLRTLWTGFSKLLLNPKDKVMRVLDLLRRLQVSPTALAQRVFEIGDVRGISQVSFKDFIMCYWNYCTLDRTAIIGFCYDVLLAENRGDAIELASLRGLIEEVLGSTLSAKSRRYIDEAIARAPSARLLPRQFFYLADKDRPMLRQAFALQMTLIISIGGKVSQMQRMRMMNAKRKESTCGSWLVQPLPCLHNCRVEDPQYFWRLAAERRKSFSNAQSWKDLVKQMFPGTTAHPDSLPAASRVLPGAGVDGSSKDKDKSGSTAPGGMARIAQRAEDRLGGAAAPVGVGQGQPDVRGGRRRASISAKGAPGMSTARAGAVSGRAADADAADDGARGGSGQPTAAEARELIKRAAVSEYFTSGRPRKTEEARVIANMAQAVPSAATPYVFPQIVRVLGAGGGEGSWPTNPNTALGMAMGLDPSFAVALTKSSRVKGYYRRARKPNMPQYVLHTAPGTASAQFSMPGVQDGVRGRWRHMRSKATIEDKRAGFAIARGGGFFSGIGLNRNRELDGVFDAEVIRIRPKEKPAPKAKGFGAVAGSQAAPATARSSAKGVAGAMSRLGQAPNYRMEGYASVAAKQREIEKTMAEMEAEQLRRQEEAAERVLEMEEADQANAKARAEAAARRLAASSGSRRTMKSAATPSRRPSPPTTPVGATGPPPSVAAETPADMPAATPSLVLAGGLVTTSSKRRLPAGSLLPALEFANSDEDEEGDSGASDGKASAPRGKSRRSLAAGRPGATPAKVLPEEAPLLG